jgi:hypothetical protein
MILDDKIKLSDVFADDVVVKFCYYNQCNRIELYYDRYYNQIEDENICSPCIFVIEKWGKAIVRSSPDYNFDERLEDNIAVIKMIFDMKFLGEYLYMFIETSDGKFLSIHFEMPTLNLIVL